MQIELSEKSQKLVEEYNQTLRFRVSATQIVNDMVTDKLGEVLYNQKPDKKAKKPKC
jgi:hypothetical protein